MEEETYELITDKAYRIVKEIEQEVEKELNERKPYFVKSKKELHKRLTGSRGIQFILRQLKKKYNVIEDGSWYILWKKKQ